MPLRGPGSVKLKHLDTSSTTHLEGEHWKNSNLTWVNDPPAASPTKPCTLTDWSKNVNCDGQKRHGRADSLNGLGASLRALGQHEGASSCLRAALEIFEELQTRRPRASGRC